MQCSVLIYAASTYYVITYNVYSVNPASGKYKKKLFTLLYHIYNIYNDIHSMISLKSRF